jgi:hypothetical protein
MSLWSKVSKFDTLLTSNSLQLNPSLAIYVFDGLYFNSKSYEVIKMYNLTWTKVENITLKSPSLSPPIPSFSGIPKVIKFY